MKEVLRAVKHWGVRRLKFTKRLGLKNRSFTIISNNCTVGYIYQYYGIAYNSPTAGLLFDACVFLKICRNPKHYFSQIPRLIELEECQHAGILKKMGHWGSYPVAVVDDIEIYFMHYPTREEALDKWTRRCKRIRYDNMVFMLTENETCTEDIIRQFCKLPAKNKICLTYNKYDIPGTIYSSEVHELEGHPWKPEIVQAIIDWKLYLNKML